VSDFHGGYGDELAVEELIARLEVLNSLRARERCHPGAEYEDLLQEARIACWRAATTHPGHSREYYSTACRNRLTELAARGTWTGHTRQHGQPVDPLRQQGKRSLDDPEYTLTEALEAPGWVEAAQLAYHHGALYRALGELSPKARTYVWRRFWCGWTTGELDAVAGGNSWRVWQAARQQLQGALSQLR
jgi:DNA-directed RNA polymerase specialized sigma24 family protein